LAHAAVLTALWRFQDRLPTPDGRQALLKMSAIAIAATLITPASAIFQDAPNEPTFVFLDVRRGHATLAESPSGAIALIDAGGLPDGRRLADSLRRQGRCALDLVVITADDPGAWGGISELARRLRIVRVILPAADSPSAGLLETERLLTRRGIPYEYPRPDADGIARRTGPPPFRWEFITDGPTNTGVLPAKGSLSVRVETDHDSLWIVRANSGAALRRLAGRGQNRHADILRLLPAADGSWPHECAELLARSGCRLLVAGSGDRLPEEGGGCDLAAEALRNGIRLLTPHRHGSLRCGNLAGPVPTAAFRDGRWTAMEF
jgi:glyoxylase-like metal-dependent hydrolase (beta-lactamase superfamily II)